MASRQQDSRERSEPRQPRLLDLHERVNRQTKGGDDKPPINSQSSEMETIGIPANRSRLFFAEGIIRLRHIGVGDIRYIDERGEAGAGRSRRREREPSTGEIDS